MEIGCRAATAMRSARAPPRLSATSVTWRAPSRPAPHPSVLAHMERSSASHAPVAFMPAHGGACMHATMCLCFSMSVREDACSSKQSLRTRLQKACSENLGKWGALERGQAMHRPQPAAAAPHAPPVLASPTCPAWGCTGTCPCRSAAQHSTLSVALVLRQSWGNRYCRTACKEMRRLGS